jgi:hypothetical protein
MAAINSLSVYDKQPTPVLHVFGHKSHSQTELVLIDTTDGLIASARPYVSVAKLPSKDRNVRKLRTRVVMPIIDMPSGNNAEGYVAEPRKVGESLIVTDYVIHTRMSDQGIKDMLAYHRGLTADSTMQFQDPYQNDQANY